MGRKKKSAFMELKSTIGKLELTKKEIAGKTADSTVYERDIIDVIKQRRSLTKTKATQIMKRMNLVLKEKASTREVDVSEFYFEEEVKERKEAEKILKQMRQGENIEDAYLGAQEILKDCAYSNELYLNYELGNFFFENLDMDMAMRRSMEHYEKNLLFYIENKLFDKVDVICRRVAYYYQQLDELSKAVFLYNLINQIPEKKLEHFNVIKLNLGIAFAKLNQFEKSLELVKDLKFKESLKHLEFEANFQMGHCLAMLGKFAEAEKLYLTIQNNGTGMTEQIENVISNRAELYMLMNEREKVAELYNSIKLTAFSSKKHVPINMPYKAKVLRICNLCLISKYLGKKDDILLCAIEIMKIELKNSKRIRAREKVLHLAIKNANKDDFKLIKTIINYILENRKKFNLKELFFDLTLYFLENNLEDEIKTMFFRLNEKENEI